MTDKQPCLCMASSTTPLGRAWWLHWPIVSGGSLDDGSDSDADKNMGEIQAPDIKVMLDLLNLDVLYEACIHPQHPCHAPYPPVHPPV